MTDRSPAESWLPVLHRPSELQARAGAGFREREFYFGGEMVAQSVATALAVETGRRLHALSTQFLRPGALSAEIDYEYRPIHSGRSFSRSEVTASQNGRALCVTLLSLIAEEAPRAPEDDADLLPPPPPQPVSGRPRAWHPIVDRVLARNDLLDKILTDVSDDARRLGYWIRPLCPPGTRTPSPDVFAAYASDRGVMTMAIAAASMKDPTRQFVPLTLNHDLRLHHPFDASDYVHMTVHAHLVGEGRSYCTGTMRDRKGRRVVSYSQEGLLLPRPAAQASSRP